MLRWMLIVVLFSLGNQIRGEEPPKTKSGTPSTDVAASEKEAKIPEIVIATKKDRLAAIDKKIKALNAAKSGLKSAMISDDDSRMKSAKQSIESSQKELVALIDEPIAPERGSVGLNKLRKGDFIRITSGGLKYLQVLDQSTGTAIVHHPYVNSVNPFIVTGVDLTDVVDNSVFSSSYPFFVEGTTRYKTVSGGSNTVFELREIREGIQFTDAELKPGRDAVKTAFAIELSKEEQQKVAAAQQLTKKKFEDERAAKRAELEKKEAEQATKDAEAKASRAKGLVDLGKSLSSKGNYAGARKQFEKAIAESPNSPAGKQAKDLLDELPK